MKGAVNLEIVERTGVFWLVFKREDGPFLTMQDAARALENEAQLLPDSPLGISFSSEEEEK